MVPLNFQRAALAAPVAAGIKWHVFTSSNKKKNFPFNEIGFSFYKASFQCESSKGEVSLKVRRIRVIRMAMESLTLLHIRL